MGRRRSESISSLSTDAELLERVVANDDGEAFGEFYDRHHRQVLAFLNSRTMSEDVAADLAAETFASALTDAHRFDATRGVAVAWLLGIARHHLHQYFRRGRVDRRARSRLKLDLHCAPDDYERAETLIDADRLRPQVALALGALRPKLREAVLLRVVRELSYEGVAVELGISAGAARVRVMRGLRQMGRALEEEVQCDTVTGQ